MATVAPMSSNVDLPQELTFTVTEDILRIAREHDDRHCDILCPIARAVRVALEPIMGQHCIVNVYPRTLSSRPSDVEISVYHGSFKPGEIIGYGDKAGVYRLPNGTPIIDAWDDDFSMESFTATVELVA